MELNSYHQYPCCVPTGLSRKLTTGKIHVATRQGRYIGRNYFVEEKIELSLSTAHSYSFSYFRTRFLFVSHAFTNCKKHIEAVPKVIGIET